MKFVVSVGHMSGESNITLETKDAKEVSEFLSQHDHEGSSVGLTIMADYAGHVYGLLDVLLEWKRKERCVHACDEVCTGVATTSRQSRPCCEACAAEYDKAIEEWERDKAGDQGAK